MGILNKLWGYKRWPTNPNHPRYLEFHPEIKLQPKPSYHNHERRIKDLQSKIIALKQKEIMSLNSIE